MPVPLYQAKAEFFRTLGHPARIRVLELLQDGPRPVRELLAAIDIEASSLSQQLAVLRRTQLVTATRDGNTVVYALSTPDVSDLLRAARTILTEMITDQGLLLDQLRTDADGHDHATKAARPGKDRTLLA
ncbi:putative transcriptional regulatory protein ArsR [Kitasatospora herbaricolor]|uniref:ArsR/SmtB family transcription factor n=1 Tax=Kitasatospora herbaricolor TaxID=68217 RepID=UPI00174CB4BD|nr:metalloregulator ArsR/SmtB family transcription factor [Kitasatospora herbaricolor]MDQ0308348.1 ArsR family transcriptional regulator [Kitasatospora herbaricolor]GGV06845.1 putative transcriptional regulatory protein ArsR [Kitasatospora herbaricolor]